MVTLRKTLQPNFPQKEFKKILPYDKIFPTKILKRYYFASKFPHKDFKTYFTLQQHFPTKMLSVSS